MKLIPRNYDLFADVFDDMFNSSLTRGVSSIMKTDIHEKDGNYVVDVELPGYKKEDIGIDLKNGYLSISAKHEPMKQKRMKRAMSFMKNVHLVPAQEVIMLVNM